MVLNFIAERVLGLPKSDQDLAIGKGSLGFFMAFLRWLEWSQPPPLRSAMDRGKPFPTGPGPAGGAAKRLPNPLCDRAAFRMVVDVGHTAQSPGAMSARGFGDTLNLRLATRIERILVHAGFGRTVLLVTDGPTRRDLRGDLTIVGIGRRRPDFVG